MARARDIDPGPVAVARAVIRRPLTAQARARYQAFHEVDKWPRDRFLSTPILPCQYHSNNVPFSAIIMLEMDNRQITSRS